MTPSQLESSHKVANFNESSLKPPLNYMSSLNNSDMMSSTTAGANSMSK